MAKIPKLADFVPDPNARALFLAYIEQGWTYKRAMAESGINALDAALCIDEIMGHRRDGAGAFLMAEEHLVAAMKTMSELMEQAADEKVQLAAAAKLADTSYKILNNKRFVEQATKLAEKSIEKVRRINANTWDAEFEQKGEGNVSKNQVWLPNPKNSIFQQDDSNEICEGIQ